MNSSSFYNKAALHFTKGTYSRASIIRIIILGRVYWPIVETVPLILNVIDTDYLVDPSYE